MEALPQLPSDRRFGLTFCVIFLALGIYAVVAGFDRPAAGSLLVLGAVFGLISAVAPRALEPMNKLWFHFGLLLGRIVSPVVLGVIFYGLLTPIAWFARRAGRDELHLKRRAGATYWIHRTPPGPASQSFTH